MEKQSIQFLCKISIVPNERPSVVHLGFEHPKVTLRETKGCFRRGTEKFPLQALQSGE
ncbi:hypothetical protein ACUXG3_006134 [Bacillus thuringiensis]